MGKTIKILIPGISAGKPKLSGFVLTSVCDVCYNLYVYC